MKVFVSYRHDDTPHLAGRIADWLRARPDFAGVFIDVDVIKPGANFADSIQNALQAHPACVVLIGPEWIGPRSERVPRINDPDDWVRIEVATMLRQDLKVVPVLAGGVRMPKPEDLPEELRPLTQRLALPVQHESFHPDMTKLATALLGRPPRQRSVWRTIFAACVGLVAALIVALSIALVHGTMTGTALNERIGNGPVALFLYAAPAAGMAVGLWLALRHR